MAKPDICKCLQALGFPYTEDAALKSELRILGTLHFDINARRSPCVYTTDFLKLLSMFLSAFGGCP